MIMRFTPRNICRRGFQIESQDYSQKYSYYGRTDDSHELDAVFRNRFWPRLLAIEKRLQLLPEV